MRLSIIKAKKTKLFDVSLNFDFCWLRGLLAYDVPNSISIEKQLQVVEEIYDVRHLTLTRSQS